MDCWARGYSGCFAPTLGHRGTLGFGFFSAEAFSGENLELELFAPNDMGRVWLRFFIRSFELRNMRRERPLAVRPLFSSSYFFWFGGRATHRSVFLLQFQTSAPQTQLSHFFAAFREKRMPSRDSSSCLLRQIPLLLPFNPGTHSPRHPELAFCSPRSANGPPPTFPLFKIVIFPRFCISVNSPF